MKSIRNLSLFIFIVAFIHASLLLGFFSKLGIIGAAVSIRLIENNPNPIESIPFRIYIFAGDILWNIGIGEKVFDAVYSRLFERGENDDVISFLMDIRKINIIVLVSLLSTILLSPLARTATKKKKEEAKSLSLSVNEKKDEHNDIH